MTESKPSLGPIAWAAVRVPPGRAGAWRELTGWGAESRRVDETFAAQLDAPQAAGLPLMILAPRAGVGGLHIIESEGAVEPLRSLGWAAAELTVADLEGVARRAEPLGFRVLGAPRALGSGASIRACQLADPGGAVLYCADVRGYEGTAALQRATEPVDRVFIAVLASPDLEATRAWYAQRFGVVATSDHSVPIPILDTAWNRPTGTKWRISSQQLGGGCLLEIDQYPARAPGRERNANGLPGGVIAVALVSQQGKTESLTGPAGERLLLVARDRQPMIG
jgi:hypothetical protein